MRKNVYDIFQMQGIDLTVPQAQANVDTTAATDSSRQDYGFDRENLR